MLQRALVRSSAVEQPAIALIARAPARADRRAAMVRLTEPGGGSPPGGGGEALVEAKLRGVDGFSAAEVSALVLLFQRLVANLEREPETIHHE